MDPASGRTIKKAHDTFKKEWTGVLILLSPNEELFTPSKEKVSINKRLWHLLKPHRGILIQAFVGALVYTLLGFSTSIYIQKLTDFVLVNGNTNLLNLLSITMVILLIIQIVLSVLKDTFLLRTGQLIDARLILGYYKHLLKLPQQFFDHMRVGEIISRIGDAVKIRSFINEVSLNLSVNVLIVIFSFALMFTFYWKLGLIMLSIIPAYLIIYFITNRLNKSMERKVMEKAADLESQLVESLNAISTIKRFGLEDYANAKTEKRFISLLKSGFTSALNGLFTGTSSTMLNRIFTIILLWTGSYFVIDRSITPGQLLSFYAIIGYFTGPVASLVGANKSIQNALIAADRLFEIIDLEREQSDNKVLLESSMLDDIEFKNVSFRYGSRIEVFENLNLKLPYGRITAIVGESGSGKSTLAALLQNIYPLKGGSISIGDLNLQYISNESLRRQIAVVPQKIDLFAGNVIENIAIGDYEPDMKRILSIASSIGILDFIESLPQGFDTYLGENGSTLSGGQKQRIAIARALYQQPNILILDEATSSLDTKSENYIQKTIHKMREEGKTIIIIAHRLSTVTQADKIVVMDKGRVIEEGSHVELYESHGAYYQLWQQQIPILSQKISA
jgi:ABC-type bacteriocin/lantibiotic exporter with double-glycine peptidase domain